jgi:hypothetical protein
MKRSAKRCSKLREEPIPRDSARRATKSFGKRSTLFALTGERRREHRDDE